MVTMTTIQPPSALLPIIVRGKSSAGVAWLVFVKVYFSLTDLVVDWCSWVQLDLKNKLYLKLTMFAFYFINELGLTKNCWKIFWFFKLHYSTMSSHVTRAKDEREQEKDIEGMCMEASSGMLSLSFILNLLKIFIPSVLMHSSIKSSWQQETFGHVCFHDLLTSVFSCVSNLTLHLDFRYSVGEWTAHLKI